MTQIIYNGTNYRVGCHFIDNKPRVIVSFDHWKGGGRQGLNSNFFGMGFFRNRHINFIGVQTARNDWYQHQDILDVINTIRIATIGRRVATYGASMGAYAAINFAEDLHADTVIAVAPQYTINPQVPGHDPRWYREAQGIDFNFDKIDRPSRIRNGYIVFDPYTEDGNQARRILERHDFMPIRVPFSEHQPSWVLQEAQVLDRLVHDAAVGTLDLRLTRALLRGGRRQSASYWLGVSKVLDRRGWREQALKAARAGLRATQGETLGLAQHLARMLAEGGGKDAALAILAPYLEHPEHGSMVKWQSAEILES